MTKVLVTGGAGYIGSHTVKKLGEAGYEVVIYDNLSTGSADAILYGELIQGELSDTECLGQVFANHKFNAVLHFAASISVPESLEKPLAYYHNNTCNVVNLLRCCESANVNQFVFSSTAAVYGEIQDYPVKETSSTIPINPYGQSKLMSERIICDYAKASQLKYVILRYFNVAGADSSGRIGQMGKKAAHLIKVGCDAALGIRPSASIFGTDYSTPDGTGIRDYIHVEDLAAAHVNALAYLEQESTSQILNCGYGSGYSVKEVLSKIKEISGVDFTIIETPPRAGDPACVVASGDKIREVIGWQPQHNSLDEIVSSALAWEKKKLSLPNLV
ncbi:UDP-glucose 4-epimerase GalE [Waterburya agarophytonicola]|nr:UDP-glucose 4-epimerase GalE [Waterburya agarophytonicola]